MSENQSFNTALGSVEPTFVVNTLSDVFNVWEYSPQVRIHTNSIRIFVTYVLTVQGALGNVITMVVVFRNGLRTTTNILLFSLCFFDGLYSATNLVSLVIDHVRTRVAMYVGRLILFELWPVVNTANQLAVSISFHVVAVVSFERFIAVCLPLTASSLVTPLRVKCVLAVIVLYCLAQLAFSHLCSYLPALVFIKETRNRARLESVFRFRVLYSMYMFSVVSSLPLCVVILCTSMTIVRLVFKRNMTNCSAGKKNAKEKRAANLMLNVCILYIIFVLPVACLQVYRTLRMKVDPFHQTVIVFCYQLNASVNFVAYVTHSPKFSRFLNARRRFKK